MFSENRCRINSLNALDVTSVAGTQVRWRRTWKRILSANVLAMTIRMKKILIMKRAWFQKRSRQRENSERTKPQVRSASNQTQNPNCASKEISAAGNTKQPSAKKAASGINRTARSTSWCASVKAVETEALIHPFLKIIREGTNCILLWLCDQCEL